jgi:hypothetical protein
MSDIDIGTIIDIQVIPYDVREVKTVDARLPYSPYNYNNIVENCSDIKETLILQIERHSKEFPIIERITNVNITAAWFCSIDCLAVGLYEPSVLFASISAECILNHDLRLEGERQKQNRKWLELNWRNLKTANEKGLPTEILLNPGETFAKDSNIEFVTRRNKVAHGDLEGYYSMYPAKFDPEIFGNSDQFDFGHNKPSRVHALDQINKAKNFIIGWANQKPKIRLH